MLKGADLSAEDRLRDVQLFWRSAEVSVIGHRDEVAQLSEVLGTPIRYERQSLDDFGSTLAQYGMGDAFVHGMVEMMLAKDDGLDDGAPRTSDTTSPTTFRQWCEEVLKPVVTT